MENKNQRIEEELEQTLYSTLNVGSFLEAKKRTHEYDKKELSKELYQKETPKRVIPRKIDERILLKKPKEIQKQEAKSPVEVKKKTSDQTVKEEKIEELTVEEPEQQNMENTMLEEKEDFIEPEGKKEEPKEEIIFEEEVQEENKIDETSEKEESQLEKTKKEKKQKKSKKLLVGVVICILLDIGALTCLFLAYGPISYFRNLLITSAMTTQNHHYLAYTLYSEETVEKVLNQNKVNEITENTNSSDIDFSNSADTGKYDSIYEEQILKRDEDALYKVIDIKGKGYAGYLVAIYDASRVSLVGATKYNYGGKFLTDIAKENKAKVAINASGFSDQSAVGKGSVAVGTVIKDGQIINYGNASGYGGGIAGFNKDHVLVLTKENAYTAIQNGMVDAVEFGPFLIVNGKAAEIKGNGGWGIAPRTVLAQRKDGIVLFLVIDGRNAKHSLGVDMKELIKILTRYKAHNAVNLDGGGSSTLVVEGKLTNIPCGSTCGERYVPNAWIVK